MAYETPLRPRRRVIAMREAVAAQPKFVHTDKVDIHIFSLGENTVELLVNLYFRVATFSEEMEARDWINREILQQAKRLNVEIGMPQQTLLRTDAHIGIDMPVTAVWPPKFLQTVNSLWGRRDKVFGGANGESRDS